MTAGDFSHDIIFRLDPAGGSDDLSDIEYPPISYILWIMYIVLMPVILTNMLVCSNIYIIVSSMNPLNCFFQTSLAVGDTNAVQEEAQLLKLAQQVSKIMAII